MYFILREKALCKKFESMAIRQYGDFVMVGMAMFVIVNIKFTFYTDLGILCFDNIKQD